MSFVINPIVLAAVFAVIFTGQLKRDSLGSLPFEA